MTEKSLRELAENAEKTAKEIGFSFDDFMASVYKSIEFEKQLHARTLLFLMHYPESANQAFAEYAKSLKKSIDELTENERKQALFNHFVEKASEE